jgi:sRNA-binding protein
MDGSEARSASRGLGAPRVDIEGKTDLAEQYVRSHLDQVRKHIEQGRVKVTAAQAEIKNWAEEKKTATGDKIADWKVKRELQNRAAQAERYAAAAADVAVAALVEAEEAALEAWLARQDAKSVLPNKASELVR